MNPNPPAIRLQDAGADTVDANRMLGFGDDERMYACVPFILDDIGVSKVLLDPVGKSGLVTFLGSRQIFSNHFCRRKIIPPHKIGLVQYILKLRPGRRRCACRS